LLSSTCRHHNHIKDCLLGASIKVVSALLSDLNLGFTQQVALNLSMSRSKSGQKQGESLGRALQKHRAAHREVSQRHTTEEHGPMVSVTEIHDVDDFLSQAQAANRAFEAERGHSDIIRHEGQAAVVVSGQQDGGYEDDDGEDDDEAGPFQSVPRRPDWRESGEGGESFAAAEQDAFLRWRRRLHKALTGVTDAPPFERNLDFWRQLWRVVELSDIVVQVVDARDPLYFYSADLADYVAEVSPTKRCVVLINKADLLSKEQRQAWGSHLGQSDVQAVFFSAASPETDEDADGQAESFNTPTVLGPAAVLHVLRSAFGGRGEQMTVGFTGYPNVGKSSTINRFLTSKKLQVSETPGKTKHYQTHVVDGGGVTLVDGPGLVMPDLTKKKADMVLAGILPIDNLTDHAPATDLMASRVSVARLEKRYGLSPGASASAARTAGLGKNASASMGFLSALALARGYMKPGGVPDQHRAARMVLRDYVSGKLLFCRAPPDVQQEDFDTYEDDSDEEDVGDQEDDLSLDETFPELRLASNAAHVRRPAGVGPPGALAAASGKKHGNRKKREKARRLYKNPYE